MRSLILSNLACVSWSVPQPQGLSLWRSEVPMGSFVHLHDAKWCEFIAAISESVDFRTALVGNPIRTSLAPVQSHVSRYHAMQYQAMQPFMQHPMHAQMGPGAGSGVDVHRD